MRIASNPILLAACLASCSTLGPEYRILDTREDRAIAMEELADLLAGYDVVFLGELHDSDVAHRLQLSVTEALLARRGELAVSLEMFERDVQPRLDLYLAQAIDEERFLSSSRPWPNYAEHYRPVIELARREGLDVIAANCPRSKAASVGKEGLAAVVGDPWCAYHVDAGPGEYRERFVAAMGDHAGDLGARMDDFFAAQCIKDDTMAESIARYLSAGAGAKLVVHWCGRFHSDFGLGTVERLLARRPETRVAVVTTIRTERVERALADDERATADYVWLVRD